MTSRGSEQQVFVGDTQRFGCQVIGYPPPTIRWYKDEQEITSNPRYNISYDKNHGIMYLNIFNVNLSDEGCYKCHAQNTEGQATTTAFLVVKVDQVDGHDNDYSSMTIEKVSEQETTQVQMARTNRQAVIEEVIERVEESEKEVIEEKQHPPKITYDEALKEALSLKVGSSLYIEVDVSGQPKPRIQWYHSDAAVEETARTSIETGNGYSFLKVKGVTLEQAGVYRVTADNPAGTDSASFRVIIKSAPSAPRNIRVIEVYKDYMVVAWEPPQCDGGEALTGYQVEKSLSGGVYVNAGYTMEDATQLKVTKLYEGNEYKFRVMAENRVGVGPPVETEKAIKAKLPFDPPGVVENLSVQELYKDYITIGWEPPANDGGSPVVQYIVEKRDVTRSSGMWVLAGTVDAAELRFRATKLFQGNLYQFRVFAENQVGPGEPATMIEPVEAKLPYDKPQPPQNLRATETQADYIVISWDAPQADGGSPITGYVIEKRDAKRSGYIYIADVDPETFTYKATRLFEGYEYYFRVIAENLVGPSDPVEMEKPVKAKLPYDEPGAPQNLRVTEYWTDYISLAWDAPEQDGGSPITGYIIEKRDALRNTWVKAGTVASDQPLSFTAKNLFEGAEYYFRVFAENKVGPSLQAAELEHAAKAKMPFDPPFAPQNLRLIDYSSSFLTIAWDPPEHDGGSPISGYIVEKRDALRNMWMPAGKTDVDTRILKVDNLLEGEKYFVRVAAENQVGRGYHLETDQPITAKLPFDKPSTPVNLRTTEVWKDYMTLTWDASEFDGGSPITGYTIEMRDAFDVSFKFLSSVGPDVFTYKSENLTEGHEYYYRVFAQNAAGLCEKAAEIKPAVKAQLPYSKPTPPQNISVTSTGKGTISLAWDPCANDGGSPITAYVIEVCLASDTNYMSAGSVSGDSRAYTVEGLIDGSDYYLRVRAENAAGCSKPAELLEPVKARVPLTKPGTPEGFHVEAITPTSVTLAWSAPKSDGGAKINKYFLERQENDGDFTPCDSLSGATYSSKVEHLKEQQVYNFRLLAANSLGKCDKPAALQEAVTTTAKTKEPAAPRDVTVTEVEPTSITITWQPPQYDGGAKLKRYVILCKEITAKKYKKVGKVAPEVLTYTITESIVEGKTYVVQVFAENEVGLSKTAGELEKPVKVEVQKPVEAEVVSEVPAKTEAAPEPEAKPEVVEEEVTQETEKKPEDKPEKKKKEKEPKKEEPEEITEDKEKTAEQKPEKTEPSSPCDLSVTSVTSDSITVTWGPPESDGGSKVKRYIVMCKEVKAKKYKKAGKVAGDVLTYTVTANVEADSEYLVQVFAENDVGTSKSPAELSAPARTKPAEELKKPQPVDEAVEPEGADVPEQKPKDDEPEKQQEVVEEPITEVEAPTAAEKPDSKVEAEEEKPVHTVPQAPEGLAVASVDEAGVTLAWAKPSHDGGAPVTGYTVLYCDAEKNKYKECGKVGADDLQLTFDSGKPGKQYKFKVVAVNEVGTSEGAAELDSPVKIPAKEEKEKPEEAAKSGSKPVISDKPDSSINTNEGDTLTISFTISGEPAPEISWKKDGKKLKIKKDPRIECKVSDGKVTFTVVNATIHDTGAYCVTLTNDLGEVTEEVAVSVEAVAPRVKAPVIEAQPTPTTVTVGDTIKLACKVTGTPSPDVVWKKGDKKMKHKNGVKIETTDGTSTLTIADCKLEHAGEYCVEVKNTAGTSSAKVEVKITEATKEPCDEDVIAEDKVDATQTAPAESAPELITAPEPVTAQVGEDVKLVCTIKETSGCEVTWLKDGKKIKKKKSNVETVQKDDGRLELQVSSACVEDSGEYTVSVTNSAGSVEATVSVVVSAKTEAPTITHLPDSFSVKPGEDINITCTITATPTAEVSWFKNGEPISAGEQPDGRLQIKTDAEQHVYTLLIAACEASDAGEYAVTAVNTAGKVYNAITVTVAADSTSSPPEFKKKPSPVTVTEFEPLIIEATITDSTEVTWFKEGKPLKAEAETSQDKDLFTMKIAKCSLLDAGEYTVTAKNEGGATFCTVSVTVEGAASEQEDSDKEIMEKLSAQIAAEKEKHTDKDEDLFQAYPLLGPFSDKDHAVDLQKGAMVEVMDREKPDEWLCRVQDDKSKVCYIPVELLVPKETEAGDEDVESIADEEEVTADETYPTYMAVADYAPPADEVDALPLVEGQYVDVLDSNNPERWLCRTRPEGDQPVQQGWVPPGYLEEQKGKEDKRTPREVFRDEVIQIDNKEQEALMKRRYALTDLIESERDYVKDLNFTMDTYYKAFDNSLPDELQGQKDYVFNTMPEIRKFHEGTFLPELQEIAHVPGQIAKLFLKHKDDFQLYVPYYRDIDGVQSLLAQEGSQDFIKTYDESIDNVGESKLSLPAYMRRPPGRIDEYVNLLKDFLRYSKRANEDTTDLEDAIQMLLELQRQAEDAFSLSQIEGYPGNLNELGPILRHDDFLVWTGSLDGKPKDRHLFLFGEKLLLTKKKNGKKMDKPTYECKNVVELQNVQLNEELADGRQFELWYPDEKNEKFIFQARTVPIKQAWCDDLRRVLKKLGYDTAGDQSDAYLSAAETEPEPQEVQPSFASQMQPVACTEGEEAHFEVKVEGKPLPEVSWSRDGKKLKESPKCKMTSDGDTFHLILSDVTSDIAGNITAKVKNSQGSQSCSAELTVKEKEKPKEEEPVKPEETAPAFAAVLKPVNCNEGEEAHFEVKVEGKPLPEVSWSRDGKKLKESSKCKMTSDGDTFHLILSDVTSDIAGNITAKAKNSQGSQSCSAELTVKEKEKPKEEEPVKPEETAPSFSAALKPVTCIEGEEAHFEVKVEGKPLPEVSWSRDGKKLKESSKCKMTSDGDTFHLILSDVTSDIAGNITAKAKNSQGSQSCSAELIVKEKEKPKEEKPVKPEEAAPAFTAVLKPVTCNEGEEAHFEVKVEGKPLPEVSWSRDGKKLKESSKCKMTSDGDTFHLILSNVTSDIAGNITAKAKNSQGSQSCSAELTVEIVEPPSFKSKLKDKTCVEMETVQFELKVSGSPVPKLTWYKDGKELTIGSEYKVLQEKVWTRLVLAKPSLDHSGTYLCKAENKHGMQECSATLTVTAKEPDKCSPTFIKKLSDVGVEFGTEARFECRIKAYPAPDIVWYRSKKRLSNTDRYKISSEDDGQTYVLTVSNVGEDDQVKWKCVATNTEGDTSSSAKIIITDLAEIKKRKAPEFSAKLTNKTVNEGEAVKLVCKVKGYPKPTVAWLQDDADLTTATFCTASSEGSSHVLKIDAVSLEHAGSYTCRLTNIMGTVDCSATLNVNPVEVKPAEVAPTFTKSLSDVETARNGTATFTCRITGEPAPKVNWYRDRDMLMDTGRIKFEHRGDEYSLIITNLLMKDQGLYKCIAINSAGEVSSSAKLYVTDDTAEQDSDISYKPSFTKRIQDCETVTGMNAQFTCKAIGEPAPDITWYHDDVEVALSDRVVHTKDGTTHKLLISNVLEADAGAYKAVVTNKAGKASCSAQLLVEVIEEVSQQKDSQAESSAAKLPPSLPFEKPYVLEDMIDSFSLAWRPATIPIGGHVVPITYTIERRDLPGQDYRRLHSGVTDTSYKISGYDVSRDYMYRVTAENQYGTSDPTSALSVYGKTDTKRRRLSLDVERDTHKSKLPPRAPRDMPVIEPTDGGSALVVTWKPAELPSYAVQTDITYILERRVPPSKRWIEIGTDLTKLTHIMKDYKCEKDYMFRVRACNDYGISEPSMSATLVAKPPQVEVVKKQKKTEEDSKPKVKPRTIWDKPEVSQVKDTSLVLTWKASSIPSYALQTDITYIVESRQPPNMEWVKVAADIKETTYKVTKGFTRAKDFYYRVRAANEYGTSEPSMPAMVRRVEDFETDEGKDKNKKKKEKAEDDPSKKTIPKHMRIIPEFIGKVEDVQYGIESCTSRIVTMIRGFPEPKIMWYCRADKLDMATSSDKYACTLAPSGELVLEIYNFSWSDVATYKVYIENDFGSASQIIKVDMADPPTFLDPMKDQIFHLRQNGKLECRVHGIPYPTVSFKKDWRVIADSHRIKIAREDYDHWTLNLRNAIYMDEGIYECVAENVAGKVYCTANVKITEKMGLYRDIKFNMVPIEDYFHVIDELGRGRYGVVRRVIDKNSGNQYAAKFLRFGDLATREMLQNELEILSLLDHNNIVQIQDGYEDKKRLIIVMEIATGGELLHRLIAEDSLTECEVAFYIRQLLLAVEYMHAQNVIHLDLKPENLKLMSNDSDELKVIDLGCAQRYNPKRKAYCEYGTPEFVSPEIASHEHVTPASDLWSVGVISYIILSGISPFHCPVAKDTLLKVQTGKFEFNTEAFATISNDAKDFISKLLVKDPSKRMTASQALEHRFMELAFQRGLGDRIPVDRLKSYSFRRKCERGITSVKTIVQPVPLSSYMQEVPAIAATEGISIDIPDVPELAVDAATGAIGLAPSANMPEAGASGMLQVMGPPSLLSGAPSTVGSGSSSEWGREYEDEDSWYEWSSEYTSGPDAHLVPSSDTGLSLRLRQYRRTKGGPSGPSASYRLTKKERRDLRDIDKEAHDYNRPTNNRTSIWQLKSMVDAGNTLEGFPPIFKQKIHDKAYNVGDQCSLRVHVIANPKAVVSWYRNDELLTEGGRIRTSQLDGGYHILTVLSTKPHDFGVYKCIARNKHGKMICRASMLMGDHPSRPGRPHVTKVSDTEAYMIWEEPETDGNSYIQAYRVDWHKPGDERWTTAVFSIDECALVKGLKADTSYRFRVAAINKFGVSPYSWASVEIRTKHRDCAPVDIDPETKKILLRSRQATRQPSPDPSPASSRRGSLTDETEQAADKKALDLGLLDRDVHLQEDVDPEEFLKFSSEVWRGRFTLIRNVKPKTGKKIRRVAKIMPYNSSSRADSIMEYEMLRDVRQEHIVRLYEAYIHEDHMVLILEKLYGENVARSLSLKNKYSEHQVSSIIKQVLDALQFLHHRGIVHLNIQPDNIIMISRRRMDIKLIDFGRARKIDTVEGQKIGRTGTAEFMAPEKVARENVGVPADIWGTGLLAFILLSGVSPFYGETDEDTYINIQHVRYDAHQLYHNITKYALKFLFQTLKRSPKARLTTEECLDHRWLMLNAPMVKSRKAAIFSTDKLRVFEESYIYRRMKGSTPSKELLDKYGSCDVFSSDEEDIFASKN